MDIDGRENKISGRDSRQFPATISPEWTFLDVPEPQLDGGPWAIQTVPPIQIRVKLK
jgi:hypothetical protein